MPSGYNNPGGFKRRYTPKTNGAKEGLMMKMKWWEDKNYDTEFSIAVSQAINIAYGRKDRAPTRDEVFEIFNSILKYKLDNDFRWNFKAYYDEKHSEIARDIEKEEQRLEDAAGGVEDLGDVGDDGSILT